MSHGWSELLPYRCDEQARYLERLLQLSDGAVVRVVMRDRDFKPGALEIDRDLNALYALLSQYPRYAWVEQIGAGRMLASPSVWEDLVKTLFTTNTVGAQRRICANGWWNWAILIPAAGMRFLPRSASPP